MPRKTFPELLKEEKPLIMPGVFDGLSAKLSEQAGFTSLFIGGFAAVGARYGVPDQGLRSMTDIASVVRDVVAVTDLPVFVDIDDGYGDVKNAVNTVHIYESIGAAAVMIEDQTWPKRCGHMAGKSVVPIEQAVAKVKAVCAERMKPETIISARTDARSSRGLDDAIRRAEAFLEAGADWIFIEAPETIDEIETIGNRFRDVPLLANPLEGGKTPILPPHELAELGFDIIPYGLSLILHVTKTMQTVLADMKSTELKLFNKGISFDDYKTAVGFDEWSRIEDTYAPK
jgi:2-methylisocitrate lyase-like PEP mutase family enzyme